MSNIQSGSQPTTHKIKAYAPFIVIINLVVLLVYINIGIIQKEDTKKNGTVAFLELAPADPRSIMQGDYMVINFAFSREFNGEVTEDFGNKGGYAVFTLPKDGQKEPAKIVRFQTQSTPKAEHETLIKFKQSKGGINGRINIGTQSFFFEEGTGEKFEEAKYGMVRIDENGNALLTSLYDENFKNIQ